MVDTEACAGGAWHAEKQASDRISTCVCSVLQAGRREKGPPLSHKTLQGCSFPVHGRRNRGQTGCVRCGGSLAPGSAAISPEEDVAGIAHPATGCHFAFRGKCSSDPQGAQQLGLS